LAGNGINAGIVYMARYLEVRRRGGDVEESIREAHTGTWLPTLTAATAAAASYASLGLSDFRGLKHFAVVGAVGMLLFWATTYLFVPAVLAWVERIRPFRPSSEGSLRTNGIRYEAPFVHLVARYPRRIAAIGIALSFASIALVVTYLRADPMEYNMKRLFNE